MKTDGKEVVTSAADEAAKQVKELRTSFVHHLRRTLAKDRYSATTRDRYYAFALAVRDRLIERWIATQQLHHNRLVKRIYYLSLEFLIGRSFEHNVMSLLLEDACRQAAIDVGLNWDDLLEQEVDAGLGNGGLGRLAACFIDSLATLNLPSVGYGLRYDFGIFNQRIVNGYQVEVPDDWLKLGYPWEIAHPEFSFHVQFEGRVEVRPARAVRSGTGRIPNPWSACPTTCPWSATAATRSTRCASGRPRRQKNSTSTTLTAAPTWTPWPTRSWRKTSPRSSTPTTTCSRARNFA